MDFGSDFELETGLTLSIFNNLRHRFTPVRAIHGVAEWAGATPVIGRLGRPDRFPSPKVGPGSLPPTLSNIEVLTGSLIVRPSGCRYPEATWKIELSRGLVGLGRDTRIGGDQMPPVRYHEGRFPPVTLDWSKLIPLIGPSAAALARYDGMLAAVPSPDVLLSPLSTQEAVLSSRIEGTQATMGEVLEFEAGRAAVSPERRDDIQEILNYRAAMREAEKLLAKLPLSQRVLRQAHAVLLSGVRGRHSAPGQYRKVPNWIGPPGCTIEEAHFVPIEPDKLPGAMSDWERYAHNDGPDQLVQLAILHAEFEALHPFLDGNGRLGRMLIPLFLWQRGLIGRPMFYISGYFESRRDAYYEALLAVSRDNAWTAWCRFFLEAVKTQAEDNLAKTKAILDLYESMKRRVPELTRSQYAMRAVDWIFQHPVFRTSDFVESAGIPAATAWRFFSVLYEGEILQVLVEGRGSRPTVLAFPALINIAEGRELL